MAVESQLRLTPNMSTEIAVEKHTSTLCFYCLIQLSVFCSIYTYYMIMFLLVQIFSDNLSLCIHSRLR
jgi:hypothetical protein